MSLDIELSDFDEELTAHKGVKKQVQRLADGWFKTPKRIALTGCVLVGCVFVIHWNLQRLSVLDELAMLEVQEFDLDMQQSELEVKLAQLDQEELAAKLAEENEKIFQGFPELAAWTDRLTAIAGYKRVDLTYQVEKARFSAVPGILEVPVLLKFKAQEEYADNLFSSTLGLLGFVLADRWHIDVVSTQGRGDGQRLLQVSVQANVWVRDLFGFVDVKTLQKEVKDAQTQNPGGDFDAEI